MDEGRYVDFVSESGALELFVFASSTNGSSSRVKKIQENLAIITGYAPLPLFHMLGFNHCKWTFENVTADIIMERNK